jgi:hypothetical protein
MKVYIGIGTTEAQLVPSYLLRQSILSKNSNDSVEYFISNICDEPEFSDIPTSSEYNIGTVFSLQRFLVPKIAFRRKCDIAIYLDSDILCLNSIDEYVLKFIKSNKDIFIPENNSKFNQPIQTAVFFVRPKKTIINIFDVFLNDYLTSKTQYKNLISDFYINLNYKYISYKFNSRDYFEPDTLFIHYTDLWTQPWVSMFRKESILWVHHSDKMMQNDRNYMNLIIAGVQRGFYRSSIHKKTLKNKLFDLFYLPPQFAIYSSRSLLFRLIPKVALGFCVQAVGCIRALLDIRTT